MSRSTAQDPSVTQFASVAQQFCGFIERRHRSQRRFIEQALDQTAALYLAGLRLPDVRPERSYNPAKRYPTLQEHREQRPTILEKIVTNLGGHRRYSKVFDPFGDEVAIATTLSDDLSDIYYDVKKGLILSPELSEISSNVIWQWRFDLRSHWGRHAVSAMNALHALAFVDPE